MSEIIGSIASYFNTRLKTPFYGLLGFWLVVLNWEFFYTLVFVSQDKIYNKTHLLKNEYLAQHFYHWNDSGWYLVYGSKLVIAFLLTYLMIWLVPRYILLPAFRAQKKHDFDKRNIKLNLEQAEEKQKTALEKESVKKLEASQKRSQIEQDIQKTDPSVLWAQDYEEFEKSQLSHDFDELIDALYIHGGKTNTINFELDRNLLAYADANELVVYDRAKNLISLTEKGRYFVKRYQTSLG